MNRNCEPGLGAGLAGLETVHPSDPAGLGAGLAGLGAGQTDKTDKSAISFSSGLRFWWSCWNRNEELYKIMQRNIIVQQWRIKPNGEKLDLLIKEQPIKPPNQNRNMFLIRTPFSIILGLLEYSQALQDHAYTHHSTSCEEKTKVESLTSLRKDKPVKPRTSKTQHDIHMKSVFDELELVMEMNTGSKSSHG